MATVACAPGELACGSDISLQHGGNVEGTGLADFTRKLCCGRCRTTMRRLRCGCYSWADCAIHILNVLFLVRPLIPRRPLRGLRERPIASERAARKKAATQTEFPPSLSTTQFLARLRKN